MQIKTYEPGYDKKEFYGYMGDVLTMNEKLCFFEGGAEG
jgi:hypothetical protein